MERSNERFGGRGGSRGGGRGYGGGGPRRGGGGRRDKPVLPMLLGEPSPSLARIKTMNIEKLEAKIASLLEEQAQVDKRIVNLQRGTPPDAEKIEVNKQKLVRLKALEQAARERPEIKHQRKAEWEKRHQ